MEVNNPSKILMLVWTLERWRREKREGKEENIQRRKEFHLIVSLPSSYNNLYLTSFIVHRVVGCVNNLLVQTIFNVYQRLVQSMQVMLRQENRFLTGVKDLLVRTM